MGGDPILEEVELMERAQIGVVGDSTLFGTGGEEILEGVAALVAPCETVLRFYHQLEVLLWACHQHVCRPRILIF